ncbi:MAG: hypothetical protein NTY03_14750 [Candidatus Bathyarchaeota archaeon]|nr:hypothetical protein [Candidatus Bathyarchaeota archaeon]
MTRKQPEDTKLLVLPGDLVDQLKDISSRKGLSLSSYAIDTFEEAIRADSMSTDLRNTVDAYHIREVQRDAGGMVIPRSILRQLMECTEDSSDKFKDLWGETGRWYGQYLKRRLSGSDLLAFLRSDLPVSWNLDECEIVNGDDVKVRFVRFDMSEEFTGLLLIYLKELMGSLGFMEIERDSVRGMATVKYLKLGNSHS